MNGAQSVRRAPPPAGGSFSLWAVAWQVLVVGLVVWLGWQAVSNAITNMQARNIPTDFDFWFATAGFDINQSLISYSSTFTYGRAFFVGLINTLIVALVGIIIATLLGFFIGVARLSQNWLTAKLASGYVEIIRNTPLLLQLLFWYNAVLKPLPGPRQSIAAPAISLQMPATQIASGGLFLLIAALAMLAMSSRAGKQNPWRLGGFAAGSVMFLYSLLVLAFGAAALPFQAAGAGALLLSPGAYLFLNNRGLYLPDPIATSSAVWVAGALALAVVCAVAFAFWARRQREQSGRIFPVGLIIFAILTLALSISWLATGSPLRFEYAQLRGFNLSGGLRVYPEFVALILGLSLYTAAFIAEIVRAGILAVSRGQSEAGLALGLRRSRVLNLIIIPQAMRVIIPPLTNQYLNLTKNSSLAVFIGFPDLVQIFAGTVLNQTGAAVQVIAITMAVYLVISLFTSLVMNIYNRRTALVER